MIIKLRTLIITALLTSFCTLKVCASKDSNELPLQDLERFTTVVEYIKNYYVRSVEDTALFENAIRGMLAGLDPHSSYFDTSEFAELKASTSGKFGGVGIEMEPTNDGFIRVISPLDDTPAHRAGILAGDLIVKINDTPVKTVTIKDAADLMKGEKGSSLSLTVIRPGEAKARQFQLVRDVINITSVRHKVLEDGFGYIRISQFQNNTGDELKRAISALKKNTSIPLKGLILDLRNNPGGLFETAVQVTTAFLDKERLKFEGTIVYAKGRNGVQLKEKAKGNDLLKGAPLVVLVNGGSASASEIVAGALQDHNRAVIVGVQTFGKGSVQTVLPLKDKRGLKLTTALYYTPAGRSIQATGIKPDVIINNVKLPQMSNEADNLLTIREEDLQGHLANGNQPNAKGKQERGLKSESLINSDYQLHEALNILKGLALMKVALSSY